MSPPLASIAAALTSTLLISVAPNVALVLFPQYASGEGADSAVLVLGQAIAAGGLLGDVFLHTLPHASGGHDHGGHGDESHGHGDAGMWILAGFSVFLVADMILRSFSGDAGHSHGHGHGHDDKPSNATTSKTAILLNLVADSLHNFTDGLAIGASFAAQAAAKDATFVSLLFSSRGGLATLSILLHELPHELGDFSILVRSGYSKAQAIRAQFGTALAAMVGTVVGLVAVRSSDNSMPLLLMTAGGFLYLATVTIIPDILGHSNKGVAFQMGVLACFAVGVALMYGVALLEEAGHDHGHGGHGHGHHHHHHHHHHEEKHIHDDHHEYEHHDHHEHHEHNDHDHHAHEHHEHGHGSSEL